VPRVLIVEDEPEIKDLIGDLLVLEGYEVHTLGRIPHGLDSIRRLKPDVIMLDLRLPGMGGVEFLRLLKADSGLRSIPVVICSGAHDLRATHAEEFAALACEVVPKPFELDDLLASVARATRRGQPTA
jgi:DNA-binding response OmpR family regulator